MQKKKSGSIAIPFLLTFLISLIVIGGAAMVIYNRLDGSGDSLLTMNNEAKILSEEDSHTVMLILDLSDTVSVPDEDDEDDSDESDSDDENDSTYDWETNDNEDDREVYPEAYSFMIMRSRPYHKEMMLIGLPNDMLAGNSNNKLEDIYKSSGAAAVNTAVSESLEINVDKYMVFDSAAFQKLVNIMGGVNFVVPSGVSGFAQNDAEQYLGPEQMENVISFGGFKGGETQRISTAASMISSMINQANGERLADNLNNTFETLINMTDSNISALDYKNKKDAVKFMLKYTAPVEGTTISTLSKFLTPYGSQSEQGFIMDTTFIGDIADYFTEPENSDESSTEANTETDTNNE